MIRLVLLALLGSAAPILIMGAVPSAIVLITAPLALIYVFAFVALTPLCGLVLCRVLPPRFISSASGLVHLEINAKERGRPRFPAGTLVQKSLR